MRLALAILVMSFAAALSAPAAALAEMSRASTIDGPSADIVGLGSVSMADDGTGGLVYLKRVDGHTHVFASRFALDRWSAPQRVDVGQQFDSSWPVIGAGDDGRLVVVWVQAFGQDQDRLYSAALDPGADSFQTPLTIDYDVGAGVDLYPSIAMNAGGQAILAYRYVPGPIPDPSEPPGYVKCGLRLARYDGAFWSSFSQLGERLQGQPVRTPTATNSPQVGIDQTGTGLVAWQEPDDDFVDRVWARRVFGQVLGNPLIVSPQTWNGKPLRGTADELQVSEAGFGEAAVSFIQEPGQDSPLHGTRAMVNEIGDQYSTNAAQFEGARIIDGAGAAGPPAAPGPTTVGVDRIGHFQSEFTLGGGLFNTRGSETGMRKPQRIDDVRSAVPPDPLVTVSDDGASASAWKLGDGASAGAVELREARADGVTSTSVVQAPRGGPVNDLKLAGSGLGDALIAFYQGGQSFGQIAAADVDAPPENFHVHTPISGWVHSRRYDFNWDDAPAAIGGVRYRATVDDRLVGRATDGTSLKLGPRQLPDGLDTVQVVATDFAGQETESVPGTIKVDRHPPHAHVSVDGSDITVAVSDGPRHQTSGAVAGATRISWGDGASSAHKLEESHRYARAGTYSLVILVRDRAGNRARLHRRVRVG